MRAGGRVAALALAGSVAVAVLALAPAPVGAQEAGGGDAAATLDEALLDLLWTTSPTRRTGFDNWFGVLDDRVNPLLAYDGGRETGPGTTAALEAALTARPAPWLTLHARPRGQIGRWRRDEGQAVLPPERRWPPVEESVGMYDATSAGDYDAASAGDYDAASGDASDAASGGASDATSAGASDATSDGASDATFLRLYARAVAGNAALTVGRDRESWGRSPERGTLLSTNARALDMVRLATDRPARLPWVLGGLGPVGARAFLADLGPDQNFPHGKLFGLRVVLHPHPRLEIGVGTLNRQGGEGAPEAGFGDRVADVLFLSDLFQDRDDYLFSDKFTQVDVLWRVPAGPELWVEWAFTDFDARRFGSTFREEAAWNVGVLWAGLGAGGGGGGGAADGEGRGDGGAGGVAGGEAGGAAGPWSLRVEGEYTGPAQYRHSQFTSGLTLDGRVLGSALGPDGRGLLVEVAWEEGGDGPLRVAARLEAESRSFDQWQGGGEENPGFYRTVDRPEEGRVRGGGSLRLRLPRGWNVDLTGALESVEHWGGVEDAGRTNALARVRVGWRPGPDNVTR